MSDRKNLRNNLLGKKAEFKRTTVEVEGNEYEVRQLSLRDRNNIIKKTYNADAGETDFLAATVLSVIYSVYVPGTDDRVFEDSDFETLCNQPASGGFIDAFTKAAGELSFETEGKEDTKGSEEITA